MPLPMRRALPTALLAWATCTCGPPRGAELPPEHQLAQAKRDPSAELWALGHPEATAALVIPDLRPLARWLDDLRVAAAAAPRGEPALAHLDTMLRAVCPGCPRRGSELEARGLGPAEGLALFLGPGNERVLALGSLRAAATVSMLESWLRRVDRTVRVGALRVGRERLTVLEGRTPWYCRQVAARLVCGSAPRVLEAALARKPGEGLFERRLARAFPAVKRVGPTATLLLSRPLSPEVVTVELGAAELRLRGYARARDLGAGPGRLLGLAEGADGLLRIRLPLAELLRRGLGLPDALRTELRRVGLDAAALARGLTGEVLLVRRGPLDHSLVLGLSDPGTIRLQLQLVYRALQLVRFTQRFRGATGPVELGELASEERDGGTLTTIGLKLQLHELVALPLPLTLEPRLFVALGDDALSVGTDRELAQRVLRRSARRDGALARDPDLRHLERAFGESAILSFWSRALDPLSGVPAPLAERLIDDALGREHRDLKDLVQTARYVADLVHDLTLFTARERELQVSELVLRPLHVDDEAHRRARPLYLRALAARHRGEREAYRRALAEVIATASGTRYHTRARLLAAGDPLALYAALGALLTTTGQRLWESVGAWLPGTRAPRPERTP